MPHLCLHVAPAAYPDRLAVRESKGSGGGRASFSLAGGATVRLVDEADPLGQVGLGVSVVAMGLCEPACLCACWELVVITQG